MRDDMGYSRQSALSILQYEIAGACKGMDLDFYYPCPYCFKIIAVFEETREDITRGEKVCTRLVDFAKLLTKAQGFEVSAFLLEHTPVPAEATLDPDHHNTPFLMKRSEEGRQAWFEEHPEDVPVLKHNCGCRSETNCKEPPSAVGDFLVTRVYPYLPAFEPPDEPEAVVTTFEDDRFCPMSKEDMADFYQALRDKHVAAGNCLYVGFRPKTWEEEKAANNDNPWAAGGKWNPNGEKFVKKAVLIFDEPVA
jgi:hypothetical protein